MNPDGVNPKTVGSMVSVVGNGAGLERSEISLRPPVTPSVTSAGAASRAAGPRLTVSSLSKASRSRTASSRSPATRPTVSVVIPAKNEARNLPSVLARIPKRVDEVILVDGQSTDVTQLMAVSCRPDIRIIAEEREGKGHALQTGFAMAQGDIVVALDADGSMAPEEVPNFLYFLQNGFDFVKGSRFMGGGGSYDITKVRRIGNRALLAVANTLHGTNFTDLCYGYFAFYRKFLEHLGPLSAGFEIEAEVTLRAFRAGLRIAEIPSMEMPRRSGQSNLRSFHDGARVLHALLRERSAGTPRA